MSSKHICFIYIPGFLISFLQGFVLLLIPLFAVDLGVSWLGVGLLLTLKSVGTLIINIPASLLVAKCGERKPMLLASICIACVCLALANAHSFLTLATLMLLLGMGVGGWMLGQHTLLSALKQRKERGRSLSLIATYQKVGMFLGPVLAGLLAEYFSYQLAFYLVAILAVISALLIMVSPIRVPRTDQQLSSKQFFMQLPTLLRSRQSTLVYASVFSGTLKFVRSARQLLVPLWGHHIGLSAAEIGLAFSLSGFLDTVLIYFGGHVSDQFGRKYSGGACMALLATSLCLLPLATDFWAFLIVALIAGIGNGIGGGIIMTLGADLAPDDSRALFIGTWRLTNDIFGAISPVLIGVLGSSISLASSSFISGGLGMFGLGILLFRTNDTLQIESKR